MMIYHDTKFRRIYETDRLIIRILDETSVNDVLTFLNKGASTFEPYESAKSSDFYTTATQRAFLKAEYNMALKKSSVRFWIHRKERSREIIGTVSFCFYKVSPFNSIMVGYKFLPEYWHQGYAMEAVSACMKIVHSVMKISRVEAFVLPDNTASQTLLSRLGYRLEGTAYRCLEVQGIRRDHLQYSFTYPE